MLARLASSFASEAVFVKLMGCLNPIEVHTFSPLARIRMMWNLAVVGCLRPLWPAEAKLPSWI